MVIIYVYAQLHSVSTEDLMIRDVDVSIEPNALTIN